MDQENKYLARNVFVLILLQNAKDLFLRRENTWIKKTIICHAGIF